MLTRSDVIAAEPKALEETVRAIVKIDDYVAGDKPAWIGVINKVTGLDKAVAADAIEQPLSRPQDVSRIRRRDRGDDARPEIHQLGRLRRGGKNMDYRFLEAATGKPKSDLGY